MTNHWIDYRHSDVFLVIGANPAENHPMAMKWIAHAKENRGAKLIVVDPRYTKTAAAADIYCPIRPGTNVAFINGIINYVLQNDLYHHEYVVNYTNASYLVDPAFNLEEGIFSPNSTWQYQREGDQIKKDPTLQDPNCVFQILKRHMARYDIATVCRITGAPEDVYREVCRTFASTGQPDKAGNVIYAMGITQFTCGSQNVRALAILQLLLGNIGIAGGGINAQRGESNVQGSTDMAMLFNQLPGYLNAPSADKHPTLKDYLEKETPKSGYWTNRPKFFISLLKAWYGDKALPENDFAYDYLPKLDGQNHSHMVFFEQMLQGKIKGFFAWGQNPVVGGPNAALERKALEQLDWLVVVDLFETETAAFWKAPGVNPKDIKTEVFLLPAAASYEKEGSITNSGRWIQWRYQAIHPTGDAKSDLWIVDRLFKALRQTYEAGGVFPEPILHMKWSYDKPGQDEPDVEKVALEINGYSTSDGSPVANFTQLAQDGSTACGCWVYSGYWFVDTGESDPALRVPATKRRGQVDKGGMGLYTKWSFAWPLNRRIVYNRCSCDPNGRPWDPQRVVVAWDGQKWVRNDVPDFVWSRPDTKEEVPPQESAHNPFIMLPEGQALLFSQAMKDGPLPEHYEPIESPVPNFVSRQQSNPLALKLQSELGRVAAVSSSEFPYIATTHRLVEHYQSGAITRNSPYLCEIMPEMFVEISPSLAQKLQVRSGDRVVVTTARGEITSKACVTPIIQPLTIGGKVYEIIGLPWHWGYSGLAPGSSANDLTPCVGDPNSSIPEYKAFLCNVRKA